MSTNTQKLKNGNKMTDMASLPASICIVVRDGVPNKIHEFSVRSRSSKPIDDEIHGRIKHEVAVVDIVWALAEALRKEIIHLVEETDDSERHDMERRIIDLVDWIGSGVDLE